MANDYDVQTTVFHAEETFKSGIWSRAPAIQRAAVLSNLARELEDRVKHFAQLESIQTGRAIREMNAQLSRLPEWL